jgi:hypothetical protein
MAVHPPVPEMRFGIAFPHQKERPRIPVTIVSRTDNASPVLEALRRILLERKRGIFYRAVSLQPRV